MSSLEGLWWVSLAIAGAALLIMLGLLLGRAVLGSMGRTREAERRRLVALLLGSAQPERHSRKPSRDHLADLSVELIQLVRGSDRDRYIETATRLGVPKRLRHHLNSGSTRVRLAAAEALSQFTDESSVARLHAALSDRSPDVRLSAAISLASMGKAPPARDLVDRLGIGTTENSLLTVALFREIAGERPDEIKALILDPTVPPGAKASAIEALSSSGDYALVPVITTLASTAHPDDPALPRYLRALAGFAHPAALPAVKRCLGSPSWEVRAAAAAAAGQIGLAELAPWLRELLGDREWWVRFRAGEALARLGEPGIRLLRHAASAGAEPARTAAAVTLEERGLA